MHSITLTGCFSSSKVEVVQEALATPVSAVPENRMELYPSPTDRFVSVEMPSPIQASSLEIFSATGKVVMRIEEVTPGMVIDLAGQSPGFYFFRFTSSGQVHTGMVVLR